MGASTVLRFTRKRAEHGSSQPAGAAAHAATGEGGGSSPSVGVFLPPRSLLLFADEAYTSCLHSIEEAEEDLLDESVVNVPPELRGARNRRARGSAAGRQNDP